MSAAQVAALKVDRDHALPGTGTHVVTFTQVFDGVAAVHGGRLNVAVTKDGKVLSYAGNPTRGDRARRLLRAQPRPGAGQGRRRASPGDRRSARTPTATQAGYTTFAKGPFAASSYVQKAAFPTAERRPRGVPRAVRRGARQGLGHRRRRAVRRGALPKDLVDHEAEGTVYENFPGAPEGRPAGRQVLRPDRRVARRATSTRPASPACAGPTTLGNNASTYANYSNFLVPADQGPRPVSPTSQFNYTYDMNWQQTKGAIVPPSYALDLNPAATNLFFHHNRIHDEFYDFGFTETAGNFQTDGGDPILGLVHAGAASGGAPTYTGRDNAYMLTLPDGIPPWSGMFLWEPINDAFEGPYSDGNFDASRHRARVRARPVQPLRRGRRVRSARTSPARWVRAGATGTP